MFFLWPHLERVEALRRVCLTLGKALGPQVPWPPYL